MIPRSSPRGRNPSGKSCRTFLDAVVRDLFQKMTSQARFPALIGRKRNNSIFSAAYELKNGMKPHILVASDGISSQFRQMTDLESIRPFRD